ncbi:MAG TPA: hypothetical protein VFR08_13715, partial [Candidatus Angelobacter sp.]|nr:hypothetical protein [Candidatus Angelobacter sp.]
MASHQNASRQNPSYKIALSTLLRVLFTLTVLLAGLRGFAVAAAAAPQTPPAKPGCQAAEYRQFDFWIGDWEVQDLKGNV